jgi:hypothetical protein
VSRSLRLCLAVSAITAPPAIAVVLRPDFLATPWFFGMWVTLYFALTKWSSTSIFLRALVTAFLGGACLLLHPFPVLGGLYLGVITAYAGWSTRRGLDNVLRFIPVVLCFLITRPPIQFPGHALGLNALWAAGLMALSSLWLLLTAVPLLRDEVPENSRDRADDTTAAILAVVMGLVVGISTTVVLIWWPSFNGAWLMLTILVMVQANTGDTLKLSRDRIVGTLLGLGASLLLSPIAHWPVAAMVVGTLIFLIALWALNVERRPYWQYVALLTPAVVMLDSSGRDVAAVAFDRLVFTLVGIAIAIPTVLLIHFLAGRAERGRLEAAAS